ncbi:MAG TPA: CPBP family intramembrane glutamic endopeptidase [Terriglobales bacterium]|nr:CPBP family intramembrane glutamic endopeptidase [Terriglobales bacterium]
MTALLTFFVVTYMVAWGFFLAASITPAAGPRGLLFLLGTFTPGFVALWFTGRATGRSGVTALLRRLIDWRVPARWYVFAVSYIAVVKLTVALVHRAATGAWPRFGEVPWYLMLAATVGSTLVGGQAGEEIGWRGYALPRLAARFGLGGGSVVLGVLWASWHLPLFFVPEADTFGQSFPLYLLQVTALSVAMAWLYANTRGSLLPVMLLHAAVNNTKDIVPSAEPNATNPWALSHSLVAWLTVAVLSLCAAYFLLRMRKTTQLAREVAQSVAT